MAPARSSARRAHGHHDVRHLHNVHPQPIVVAPEPAISKDDIFLEPMMGTPQAIYVEKDVDNRDHIVELITVSSQPSQTCLFASFCLTNDVLLLATRQSWLSHRQRPSFIQIVPLIRASTETWRCSLSWLQWGAIHPWYVLIIMIHLSLADSIVRHLCS